jgi:hypothetical protein
MEYIRISLELANFALNKISEIINCNANYSSNEHGV